ncbi:MAG: UDP-N-acetylmuramoyl-L-alanine--D-glutamate ligase [Candidatus Sungbacteria bacterium]|uniref:UDP-N-acetylmuramoylalanine--D-glutamate ligase n=1 Tax=Candidatus Sungiibacteriota bacterium TaxID=2750080 RepID=A0A932YVR9_9BACT|nr:UDP-N-acetylmuramoyl-L-alanine--D-glutamate ligase [Candidatus Sungbacteria bacterium]
MGLGLHGGGIGTVQFFAKLGSRVVVTDLKSRRELAPSVAKLRRFKNITYRLGGHRPADFRNADFVIQGPGVPVNSKFLKIAERAGMSVLSDVEIFFLTCPAPIIGITGTKGKSTTTWLLGQFLARERKRRIWVGGNIRKSMLAFLPQVRKRDIVVLELSSFQLDALKRRKMSPSVAVITSIFPDHLNRYPSMAAYIRSKANVFKFQKRNGVLFIPDRDPQLGRLAQSAPGKVIRVQARRALRRYRDALSVRIPNFHLSNIALAVAVSRHLGVGERAIGDVLKRFRGVPSRMQLVRRAGGVEFINDTTATNPRAAEAAVIATKRRIGRGRLVVIAGGYDKGLPAGDFAETLARHAAAVVFLPGSATRKMITALRFSLRQRYLNTVQYLSIATLRARTMPEAVRMAYRAAKPAGTVLLSPGAASFGLFKHEFDRGEQFVQAVRHLR